MLISIVLANSADPDQTAPKEQYDLGLHCLLRYKLLCYIG